MKKIIILLFISCFISMSYAESISLATKAPVQYVVKKDDTLWGITNKYLSKPWQWRKLWHANASVKNPDRIYPGDVLALYQHNGQPALKRVRHGVVELRPDVATYPQKHAIPVIPYSDIKPFLDGVQVVSKIQIDTSAYIVAIQDDEMAARLYSHIFVRDLNWHKGKSWHSSKYFSIFRVGNELFDPQTRQPLGIEAINVGEARIVHRGDPSTLVVTKLYEEIVPKNRVLPMPARISASDFYPRAPRKKISGQIISGLEQSDAISQHQVVIIDRGRVNGIRRGDVLFVYRQGRVIADPMQMVAKRHIGTNEIAKRHVDSVRLPDQRIGELLIFRVFGRVSYGLVVEATKTIHKLDMVRNPV